MSRWEFSKDAFRYEGGADNSADVEFGYRFDLCRDDGQTGKVNVELARGGSDMSEAAARYAVSRYLDHDELPKRIVRGTDGSFSAQYS